MSWSELNSRKALRQTTILIKWTQLFFRRETHLPFGYWGRSQEFSLRSRLHNAMRLRTESRFSKIRPITGLRGKFSPIDVTESRFFLPTLLCGTWAVSEILCAFALAWAYVTDGGGLMTSRSHGFWKIPTNHRPPWEIPINHRPPLDIKIQSQTPEADIKFASFPPLKIYLILLSGPNDEQIWRKYDPWNLAKRGASRQDRFGKFRPVILRGTWKNSEFYPWSEYEICEVPLEISLLPSPPPFGPKFWRNMRGYEGNNCEEMWKKCEEICRKEPPNANRQ